MEKKMENEMEAGIIWGLLYAVVVEAQATKVPQSNMEPR